MERGQLWLLALAHVCILTNRDLPEERTRIVGRCWGKEIDTKVLGAGSEGPFQVMSSLRVEFMCVPSLRLQLQLHRALV